MLRLKIAEQQLRSFISDVRDLRGCQPNEVTALAKVREALALLQEAELNMHSRPMVLPETIGNKLRQLE